MTTAHQTPTPELTPALFADLLDPSKSPFDLCHTHNLALDQLHAVATGDHFRACVRMLEEIHAERTAAQRPQRERLALDALDRIANQTPTTNTHTETIRRAANALLRHKPQTPSPATPAAQQEHDNHAPDPMHAHDEHSESWGSPSPSQTAPTACEAATATDRNPSPPNPDPTTPATNQPPHPTPAAA